MNIVSVVCACCCSAMLSVSLVDGASVTVSSNITVKPTPEPLLDPRNTVNITLECIGSETDFSYYDKNFVNWEFKDNNGSVHPITNGIHELTGPTAQYADTNFKAGRFEFEYEAIKDTGLYQFILLINGVKYSDDGEYTCTLIGENKAVADKKTVKVTVVHPVDSVMLSLYNSRGNYKVKDSNASVANSTEAVEIQSGEYRAECKATGSNPAPKTEIKFNGTSIAVSDTGDESVVSGRPSYSSSLRTNDTYVAANDMDQLFSCEANIPGNHFQTRVVSIKVRAIIGGRSTATLLAPLTFLAPIVLAAVSSLM